MRKPMTRYNNGLNVINLSSIGRFDYNDCAVIWFFYKFMESGKMTTCIIDNKKFYWVLYRNVLENLPMLPCTSIKSVQRRFFKYVKCGLMEQRILHELNNRKGTFSLFRFTEKINDALSPCSEEEFAEKERKIKEKKTKKICSGKVKFVRTPQTKMSGPPRQKCPDKDSTLKDSYKENEEICNKLPKPPIFKIFLARRK